jgi:hypothetical protein
VIAGDARNAVAHISKLGRPGPDEVPLDALVAVFEQIFEAEAVTIFVAEAAGRLVGLACLVIRPRLNWTTPEALINEFSSIPAFADWGSQARSLTRAPKQDAHIAAVSSA